jgi:hypothetical protein
MKSIVNNITANKQKLFPKLMIHPTTGSILLATHQSDGRPYGTLIYIKPSTANSNDIGDVRGWSNEFVDFEGSVTLSND